LQLFRALVLLTTVVAVPILGKAAADVPSDPLRFFEGATESVGTLKIAMRKAVATRSVGQGQIKADGSLTLVQRVEGEGRPHVRRWLIRRVAPGHFAGTMSDAVGPVTIDQVGHRYRFRFKMKGSMSVEEWLTPLPGGKSAKSNMTVRKLGFAVATSQGTVRKIS
jgi:hypothetical protein